MRTKELYPLLFTVACLILSSTACSCKHRLHNCQKELEGSKHSLLVIKKELEDKSRKSEADLKQKEQKLMDKVNLLSVCTSELTEAKVAQTQCLRDLESEKSKSEMMAEKSEADAKEYAKVVNDRDSCQYNLKKQQESQNALSDRLDHCLQDLESETNKSESLYDEKEDKVEECMKVAAARDKCEKNLKFMQQDCAENLHQHKELLKQLREELQRKEERLSVLHAELESCNTKYDVLFWITTGIIAVVVLYPMVVSLANGEELSKKKFD